MPVSRDSAIQSMFAKTWESARNQAVQVNLERADQSALAYLGRMVGRWYAPYLARKVAQDRQLALRMQNYIASVRAGDSGQQHHGNRCTPRISSAHRLSGLFRLLPFTFLNGLTTALAGRIQALFPQKGDAPHHPLGFNYFVSDVAIEHSDRHAALYYCRDSQIDIIFEVELPKDETS